jgi:hypothetical protein
MLRRFKAYVKLMACLISLSPDTNTVFFHNFQAYTQRRVVRDVFLEELCAGQRVLHFGFLDSPFLEEKIQHFQLLHLKIKKKTTYLYGVDIDSCALEDYRRVTGDVHNILYDIQDTIPDEKVFRQDFNLILFSEVLEHLKNPGKGLENLHRISAMNGARVCVTVPNAFSLVGFSEALLGNELVHADHYHYYSLYTLQKILKDSGFRNIDMLQYSGKRLLKSPGLTGHGIIALCES